MKKLLIFAILTVLILNPANGKTEKKVEYYDNGNKKVEGHLQDGKEHGLWVWWYETGQKWVERNYQNGIRHGKSKAWYKNGNPQGEVYHKNGKQDGSFTLWYENGTKQAERFFKEGIQQGKETQWYPNGKIKTQGNFQEGKAQGDWILWDEKGNKTGQLEYKDNQLQGKCVKWNSEGNKIKETEYVKGIIKKFPPISGPFFGQKRPGITPKILAPGILSTDNQEIHCAFSSDGKEVYYSMASPLYFGGFSIYFMKEENGQWTKPTLAPFVQPWYNSVSAFSPDGKRLYFNAGVPGKFEQRIIDIWCVERTENGWGKPYHLGPVVNSDKQDTYPSVSKNGNIYFTSNRKGGKGSYDLYCSKLENGKYTPPVNLGNAINTEKDERHSCIAPDESYILFDSGGHPEGLGLFVSFRKEDGTWTKPQHLGKEFHAFPVVYHINISPDGKYLFTSGAKNPNEQPYPNRDIYWTDAKVIEQFRPKE